METGGRFQKIISARESEEMKNKYRIFQIILIIFLTAVIAILGTEYGALFMAVFFWVNRNSGLVIFLAKGQIISNWESAKIIKSLCLSC
jgi:hypothetical protein